MAIQIPYTDGFITPEGGNNFESKNNKGQVNGYAPLDANSKVPTANLPDQAALDAEVDAKITTHNSATTSVHGIANTANLVLTNDSRLSGIAGGSINTSGGVNYPYPEEITTGNGLGATGGSIDLRGGNGGSDGSSGVGGSIQMKGASGDDGNGGAGGSILMNGATHDGHSGSINLSARPDASGGSINLSAGASGPYTAGPGGSITSIGSAGTDPETGQPPAIYAGGSLIMSAGLNGAGGSINTSNGGGSINTRGVGSIQLGLAGTRTTLNGSASGTDKTITLPNATGTVALTNDSRLSDSRQPTAHKSSHATGGADPLTPSDIGAQPASPAPSIQFSNIESSNFWFRRWGRSYGSLGYAQFCPIPLTPNSGVNPLYSDLALYAPNDFTDPGHNIEFTAPYVLDMLENPAHALPFVLTPPDYKLYYSYTSKPSFISRWRIKGEHWWSRPHSVDNNSGRVVNFGPTGVGQPTFTPGYPMFGTKCTDVRSMVRQGAYSHGAVNGIATVADFVLAQTAQFKLGICIDAVADLNYRPDQIIVARGVATGSGGPAEPITYATEISSAVKATSSQIVGAVYPKLVIFNVSCNAGDTITVQFKSTGPSENNEIWLTRAMAVSMFTFDPL